MTKFSEGAGEAWDEATKPKLKNRHPGFGVRVLPNEFEDDGFVTYGLRADHRSSALAAVSPRNDDVTDYGDAAATILEQAASRLRHRASVEEIGRDLLPAVRLMARLT